MLTLTDRCMSAWESIRAASSFGIAATNATVRDPPVNINSCTGKLVGPILRDYLMNPEKNHDVTESRYMTSS